MEHTAAGGHYTEPQVEVDSSEHPWSFEEYTWSPGILQVELRVPNLLEIRLFALLPGPKFGRD